MVQFLGSTIHTKEIKQVKNLAAWKNNKGARSIFSEINKKPNKHIKATVLAGGLGMVEILATLALTLYQFIDDSETEMQVLLNKLVEIKESLDRHFRVQEEQIRTGFSNINATLYTNHRETQQQLNTISQTLQSLKISLEVILKDKVDKLQHYVAQGFIEAHQFNYYDIRYNALEFKNTSKTQIISDEKETEYFLHFCKWATQASHCKTALLTENTQFTETEFRINSLRKKANEILNSTFQPTLANPSVWSIAANDLIKFIDITSSDTLSDTRKEKIAAVLQEGKNIRAFILYIRKKSPELFEKLLAEYQETLVRAKASIWDVMKEQLRIAIINSTQGRGYVDEQINTQNGRLTAKREQRQRIDNELAECRDVMSKNRDNYSNLYDPHSKWEIVQTPIKFGLALIPIVGPLVSIGYHGLDEKIKSDDTHDYETKMATLVAGLNTLEQARNTAVNEITQFEQEINRLTARRTALEAQIQNLTPLLNQANIPDDIEAILHTILQAIRNLPQDSQQLAASIQQTINGFFEDAAFILVLTELNNSYRQLTDYLNLICDTNSEREDAVKDTITRIFLNQEKLKSRTAALKPPYTSILPHAYHEIHNCLQSHNQNLETIKNELKKLNSTQATNRSAPVNNNQTQFNIPSAIERTIKLLYGKVATLNAEECLDNTQDSEAQVSDENTASPSAPTMG
ncbi:MAG: hypothetical protein ACHQ1D_09960 [Nitrososphaerales archaeon]